MTTTWQKVIGALGLVVVLWVGDNLYDVISTGQSGGPGGAGGHQPPDGPSVTQPTDEGQQTPPDGGGHDPSQFDHD